MSDEPGDGEWGAIPDELEERIEASRDAEWEASIAKADATYPTPPPDAQAMTREMVLKIADKVFQHYPFKHELNYWLAHDAAQRETIRRLTRDLDWQTKAHNACRDEIAILLARMTASEAREKECQQTYLRIIEALEVLNDRPAVKPLASWDRIGWLIDKLKVSEAKGKWTTEKPTVAGWYWWRHDVSKKPVPLLVSANHVEGLDVFTMGGGVFWLEEIPGEWQGPLTPGEE